MNYLVAISPRGQICLYERDAESGPVIPEYWMRRPALVASGADWAIFGDLEAGGPDFWIGPGGVHVAGWGLVTGVGEGELVTTLREDQLKRIQAWRWRDGPQRVEVADEA